MGDQETILRHLGSVQKGSCELNGWASGFCSFYFVPYSARCHRRLKGAWIARLLGGVMEWLDFGFKKELPFV